MNMQQLQSQWQSFAQNMLEYTAMLGLDDSDLVCDHVALRVNTVASAESLLAEWRKLGQVISDNVINGRPIYIIELDEPLLLGDWKIDCVELPFPGEKQYPNEGWEHIELVLPSQATTTAQLQDEWYRAYPDLPSVLATHQEIAVKCSSPKGERERLANPTIAFKCANLCVKVHTAGIKAVIASEQ